MSIDEIKFQNPIVYQYTKGLITKEQCICALVNVINEQQTEIIRLTQIAPFKVIDNNGIEHIWRCPDELVPVSKAINFNKEKNEHI